MSKRKDRELYEAQDERCFYCGKKLLFVRGWGEGEYTQDHFFAKCDGNGRSGNIVLACYPCNSKKDNRTPTKRECEKKVKLYKRIKSLRREKNCRRGQRW